MHRKIDVKTGNNYRIIVISDIHAHLDIFLKLLGKIKLKETDYLIVLGDFLNRGLQNYKILKKLRQLETRPRTYILLGNHEQLNITRSQYCDEFIQLVNFMKNNNITSSLIYDFIVELDYDINNNLDYQKILKEINVKFLDELNYLKNLPLILETDDFIFSHAAYEADWDINEDFMKYIKNDYFNNTSTIQDKTVVVGHDPATNNRDYINTNLPFFNQEKNIIFIDGGLGVKETGELNAFVITSNDGKINYKTIQENNFTKKLIKECVQFPKEKITHINYPNYQVEILEKNDIYSKCLHLYSKNVLSIFNSQLFKKGNNYYSNNYINRFFNLKVGETVEVCKKNTDCISVKYNDEFGYILPRQIK